VTIAEAEWAHSGAEAEKGSAEADAVPTPEFVFSFAGGSRLCHHLAVIVVAGISAIGIAASEPSAAESAESAESATAPHETTPAEASASETSESAGPEREAAHVAFRFAVTAIAGVSGVTGVWWSVGGRSRGSDRWERW
jgi:pyruvate/2-oxoglutarate dehydrogenase complex dihydrolipoamide acyltransferase (E2) component